MYKIIDMEKDKLYLEQLSFLDDNQENDEIKMTKPYGCSICSKCLCNTCVHNCECDYRKITEEERADDDTCWNCDECYFYGGDLELSQDKVKFECEKYKMMNYYVELSAKKQRKKLRIGR